MLLACAGTAETMAPMVHTGKASTCCKFIPVCDKSFLTTKEYAICRPPHQIETYSLPMDSWKGLKIMQYPTEIKLKLNLFCKF